jgi:hypothetical protein
MRQWLLPMQVGSLTQIGLFQIKCSTVGQRWKDCFWCFGLLDSMLGYGDEFKLRYATGESYPNWEKPGAIPKDSKNKDLLRLTSSNWFLWATPFKKILKSFWNQRSPSCGALILEETLKYFLLSFLVFCPG